ncbi:hypothetical protein LWI28_012565 [Acer negundo]|uniref:Uncharacterized protein n=1 Tax=Acer negundo TaxID=4023 RepID=A0AAD5J984_ACENE|nr:hypothetical protein LWI28_012565 [Acer negundo]
MHGLVEDPFVLETTLCSSSSISFPIGGEGLISSNGELRLDNVLPPTPALCDIPVCSLVPREASPPPFVLVSSGGPFMEPLSSLLPCKVSPPAVVSLGGSFMESLPLGEPNKSVEWPL